ncbi:MAG: pyruvate kinase [Oscillospiraceae bacterium]|nr:pyruvate kinase [Oscillospiraceae bacterium]
MRKTKIVATIGPACSDEGVFREMCRQGLNVARINFSHGTHEEHGKQISMIKKVRKELNLPVAIMLDTKGPEIRIGTFNNGHVHLETGDVFVFTTRDVVGDVGIVSVSDKNITKHLQVGDRILLNNGLLIFEADEIKETDVVCHVVVGGELSDRKSMSFPGRNFHMEFLSEKDREDILFGIQNEVDFIAASFVSCKQDLLDLKQFLRENGGETIDVVAKIENQAGVDNIDEICSACEGIMVARGDLGVEIPFAELPATQKYLIDKCRLRGKRVITATEMLESMIEKIRPTRAEISDVANAVYDGTSAVMLSGETSVGKYPIDAVRVMGEIVEETEKHIDYDGRFRREDYIIQNRVDAISHAACTMSIDLKASAIVVTSLSGLTVRMVSRFRPGTPIVGVATNCSVWYKLALSWGVMPVMTEQFPNVEVLNYYAIRLAKEALGLKQDDIIVMTSGDTSGASGNTNILRIENVP